MYLEDNDELFLEGLNFKLSRSEMNKLVFVCCKQCLSSGTGRHSLCVHQLIKGHCSECDGSQICDHGKLRTVCMQYYDIGEGGGSFCTLGKKKNQMQKMFWWEREQAAEIAVALREIVEIAKRKTRGSQPKKGRKLLPILFLIHREMLLQGMKQPVLMRRNKLGYITSCWQRQMIAILRMNEKTALTMPILQACGKI